MEIRLGQARRLAPPLPLDPSYLRLWKRQSPPNRPKQPVKSPQPPGVSHLPVHHVPDRVLGDEARLLLERKGAHLGRVHDPLARGGRREGGEGAGVGAGTLGDVPDAVGLEGVDVEAVELWLEVRETSGYVNRVYGREEG